MYNLAVKFRAPFQKTEKLEVIGAYITYNDQVSAVNFYCCSYVYIQDGNINDGSQLQYKAASNPEKQSLDRIPQRHYNIQT